MGKSGNVRTVVAVLRVVAGLALIVGTPSASWGKKISYPARFKAKYPSVAEGGTVGVLNFDGRDGSNFAAALSAELQVAELDGKPVFAVKSIDGMNYNGNPTFSKAEIATANRMGQKVGVRTVITGVVMTAAINSTNFSRTETYCSSRGPKGKCLGNSARSVPCQKVSGQYSVSPRAVTVGTGTIVYSDVISQQGEYTICEGQLQSSGFSLFKSAATRSEIATPEALLTKLRQEVAHAIRLQIAPYNKLVQVELKGKTNGLSKPDEQQFSNAMAFGNAGRMDRACSIFETLHATETNAANIALLYNLGVCQEVLLPDDPGAALQYYAKADQYLTKPDKQISEAFLRSKRQVGEQRGIGN